MANSGRFLNVQLIVDGVFMQEKIDLIKTLNDETGVEESLETRMRVIGNKSYTDKLSRDVTAGATGATAVAPKFSDTLTLFQPGGDRFCPTIAEVAPKISPRLHLCDTKMT